MLHCMTCQWGSSRVPWVWPEVLEKTSPPCQGCCRPMQSAAISFSSGPYICYMLSLFHAGSSWFHSLMSVNSEIAKENSVAQKYVNLPKISKRKWTRWVSIAQLLSLLISFFFFLISSRYFFLQCSFCSCFSHQKLDPWTLCSLAQVYWPLFLFLPNPFSPFSHLPSIYIWWRNSALSLLLHPKLHNPNCHEIREKSSVTERVETPCVIYSLAPRRPLRD